MYYWCRMFLKISFMCSYTRPAHLKYASLNEPLSSFFVTNLKDFLVHNLFHIDFTLYLSPSSHVPRSCNVSYYISRICPFFRDALKRQVQKQRNTITFRTMNIHVHNNRQSFSLTVLKVMYKKLQNNIYNLYYNASSPLPLPPAPCYPYPLRPPNREQTTDDTTTPHESKITLNTENWSWTLNYWTTEHANGDRRIRMQTTDQCVTTDHIANTCFNVQRSKADR